MLEKKKKEERDLFDFVVDTIKKSGQNAASGNGKVIDFLQPEELKGHFDTVLSKEGFSSDEMKKLVRSVFDYSVKTQHPFFFNQLYAGANIYGILAEMIVAALNTSMYTYEVGPVFSLMEKRFFEQIAQMIGFKQFDGLMLAGGSLSNFYALHCARWRKEKEIGSSLAGRGKIFVSDQAHYSWKKAAIFLGLGKENVIAVRSNDQAQICHKDLSKKIQEEKEKGGIPLLVCATAGTTVFGAYDDISSIVKIAKEESLRSHVDGAWGGSVFLSQKHRDLLAGIKSVDSFARNPHKMMTVPLQCSVFMCSDEHILQQCNGLKAEYLFQQDKLYDASYDTGDKYVQCGRRIDILKLWMTRQGIGSNGLERNIDRAFANARDLAEKIKKSDSFFLLKKPSCTNVCFLYLPLSLRGKIQTREDVREHRDFFHHMTSGMKKIMLQEGEMMISIQPSTTYGLPNFFRFVVINPSLGQDEMTQVLEKLSKIGKKREERQTV